MSGLFVLLITVSCQSNQESAEIAVLTEEPQPYEIFFDS
jgi:hypothetical protein